MKLSFTLSLFLGLISKDAAALRLQHHHHHHPHQKMAQYDGDSQAWVDDCQPGRNPLIQADGQAGTGGSYPGVGIECQGFAKKTHKMLSMTVTPRLGLRTANQVETHSFKLTVKLEPVALIQVLVLNAKDSVRRLLQRWHSMTEIHRNGLIDAIQIKIQLPRRTQAELVPLRMRRLMALSQELELSAWDLRKRSQS